MRGLSHLGPLPSLFYLHQSLVDFCSLCQNISSLQSFLVDFSKYA